MNVNRNEDVRPAKYQVALASTTRKYCTLNSETMNSIVAIGSIVAKVAGIKRQIHSIVL